MNMFIDNNIIEESDNEIEEIEYTAKPSWKKATYEMEVWTHKLKNGKEVRLKITTFFRYGEMTIYLNEEEKKEVLLKDEIVFNDYNSEFICNTDSCDKYFEIVNKDKYNEEEIKEIGNLIHNICGKTEFTIDNITDCDENNDSSRDIFADDCFNEETLEDMGWIMNDKIYGFKCKCELYDENKEEVILNDI